MQVLAISRAFRCSPCQVLLLVESKQVNTYVPRSC